MYTIKQKPEDFIVNEITNIELKNKGDYSVFLMKKKNLTTEEAIQEIANKLNIQRKLIGYAGNKDKAAVTKQYISIKGAQARSILLEDVEIEFKGYLDKPISLGDLDGNEFEINVITDQKPKNVDKIVNYFGEQRFSRNNKDIGKAIIKKEFKKAVALILENKGRQENAVLDYIKEHETDYIGALRRLPIKVLSMYIHAYQSYMWNILAEKEANKKKHCEKIPIIGFGTNCSGDIKNLLEKEGINIRDFIIKQIPELTQEGSDRSLFTEVAGLDIKKEKDGYKIKFKLKKGVYATEVIKQMFT